MRTGEAAQIIRFGVNGLGATAIHYGIFAMCIVFLHFSSAGMANFVASFFGITASFIGNRYFVFPTKAGDFNAQLTKFATLYGAIALFHGLMLFVWTDVFHLNYNFGFIIALIFQFIVGYIFSKYIIFRGQSK